MNCFTVTLEKDQRPHFFVDSLNGDEFIGRYWRQTRYSEKGTLPLHQLAGLRFVIFHSWGLVTLRFTGLPSYVIQRTFPFRYVRHWLRAKIENGSQYFFNKQRLVGLKRLELLKHLVDRTLESQSRTDQPGSVYSLTLMEDFHTRRWYHHPDGPRKEKELELYLASLVTSGDVERVDDFTFRATGQALVTIERSEEEERRHVEAVKVQRAMLFLTIILIVIGMIQAGIVKFPVLLDLTILLNSSKA